MTKIIPLKMKLSEFSFILIKICNKTIFYFGNLSEVDRSIKIQPALPSPKMAIFEEKMK